jgi:flagellar motility protein MotE (MotC chaperone)
MIRRTLIVLIFAKIALGALFLAGGIPDAFAQWGDQPTAQEKLKIELIEEMKKKQKELARKEEEIKRREDRVRALEVDLGKKIDELERLQVRIDDLIVLRDDVEERNIALLSKTYSAMPPDDAAERLKVMDRLIALKILGGMKAKKSSRIFSSLDPKTATEMSEQLAKRRLD